MPRRPRTAAIALARRAVLSLALAGLLLSGAPGPVAPASADHDPRHDPVARVLVVINKATILDDNDPESEGDISINGWFHTVKPGCPPDTSDYACLTQLIQFGLKEFGADSGETVTLNRTIPSSSDKVIDESITPMLGIPVYPGQAYRLAFVGFDEDLVFDDFLGRIDLIMTEQNGWGLGTHTDRASLYRSTGGSGSPGDVSIEYQIRQVPLPDLEPLAIKATEGAGGAQDQVCVGVLNRGAMDAPPFQMALYLDGTSPPIRTREVNGLASGQFAEACLLATLPATGQHSLMVIVDEPRGIFEENDTNNWFAQPYAAARVAPDGHIGGMPVSPLVADPGPPAGASQADLVVAGIRVSGEKLGGRDACDPGRNDLTVVVRNGGIGAATGFAVRVDVDDEVKEKAVTGLAAGEEAEVTFEDVRLRRGLRELTATVDAKEAVAESKEDNNELQASVRCRDEG